MRCSFRLDWPVLRNILSLFCSRSFITELSTNRPYTDFNTINKTVLKINAHNLQNFTRIFELKLYNLNIPLLTGQQISLCYAPLHTMKLLSATRCCRQKLHGVYVRETCFKRFLEFHETVSSNRTLLYFLKFVSYFSRLLANLRSVISEGQFTCNFCQCVYTIKKGVF